MKKKGVYLLLIAVLMTSLYGCSDDMEIKPDSASDGKYSTQTPATSLEYSIYMNKQITVFTNQLSTRMAMAKNSDTLTYENEILLAKESVKIMEDTLEEVIVTIPAKTDEDDRDATIVTMQTAIDHMNEYVEDLESGKDVSAYAREFNNDFTALTGLANLYYQ